MAKSKKLQIPSPEFTSAVEVHSSGLRVVWRTVRDSLHHPQSFEVVASGDGVRVCGYSPTLDEQASSWLARILGAATAATEMIRDGLPLHTIEKVLRDAEEEWTAVGSQIESM